jgi:hypothetical protein
MTLTVSVTTKTSTGAAVKDEMAEEVAEHSHLIQIHHVIKMCDTSRTTLSKEATALSREIVKQVQAGTTTQTGTTTTAGETRGREINRTIGIRVRTNPVSELMQMDRQQ